MLDERDNLIDGLYEYKGEGQEYQDFVAALDA
jgi:hypothetical protein